MVVPEKAWDASGLSRIWKDETWCKLAVLVAVIDVVFFLLAVNVTGFCNSCNTYGGIQKHRRDLV